MFRSTLAGIRIPSLRPTVRLPSIRLYSTVDNTDNYDPRHLYPAKGSFVESDLQPSRATGRPLPVNVVLNQYAPLRHKLTHGHKVADVHLRSFTSQNLDFYCDFLLRVAFYLKIPVKGVSRLPNEIKRWTVIKSPFAHAKSKENFERITHKRVIRLYDANPDIVQIFLATARQYSITGVGLKATLHNNESLDMIESLEHESSPDSPLAVSKVDLTGADSQVAQAVLDILEDPKFKHLMEEGKESNEETK